jgi:hypothetical protein
VNVTCPAALQVNVAWMVMVSVVTPLVSGVVVTVVLPGVKPLTVTLDAPPADAELKPPEPLAVRVAGAPAGELV